MGKVATSPLRGSTMLNAGAKKNRKCLPSPHVGKVATSPLPSWWSPTPSGGTVIGNGCVAHMWAMWLHHTCRLGSPQRSKLGVCTSRAQENCTGLGIVVLKYHQGRKYRRLYGRVRCGPLRSMRDPTLKLTLTLYPGPHAAARLDPPLHARGSVSKRKGKGRCSQGVSRSVGGWAGKDRKTA